MAKEKEEQDRTGPVDLGGNWKALPVEGLGVIVETQVGVVFVERAELLDDGTLVATPQHPAEPLRVTSVLKKPEASTVSSVNVRSFMEEMERRNLSPDGEFGPLGPTLAKLRQVLKETPADSPVVNALGDLLALGDHGKFGSAAAIISMTEAQYDRFNQVLLTPEPDLVEAVVDGIILNK